MTGADLARFESKMEPEPTSGCWLWMGAMRSNGYGHMWLGDRAVGAHRISYEHWRGPITRGLPLDHLCRVRSCVNPEHLEPVTIRENLIRGIGFAAENARKTHCPAGHAYTPENTHRDVHGGRKCRACDLARFHRRAR